MNIIETKDLTKTYGKARGINDVNLSVKEGDIFGFIGPNGAGKSTTIRLLLGLTKPLSGSASICGMDCTKDSKKVLEHVGYMPSETQFYSQMRAKDVIDLAAKLHRMDCSEYSKTLCDRLKIDLNKKIEELSLGNRKKIGIVCALQHKPDLCILDEPTSGLDPLMQKEFFDILLELNKEGKTIFFSSHVLPEIQNYCNNAAIIREGRIVSVSSVEELSKSNTKKITIKSDNASAVIEGMDSLSHMEDIEGGVRFLYGGNINSIISKLNAIEIKDLIIENPSLEEVFMHIYE